LFLTSGGLISAKIISAWISSGNSAAALWIGQKSSSTVLGRDRMLGAFAPSWSLSAAVRRYQIPVRSNPPLSEWADVSSVIKRLDADILIAAMTHQIVPASVLQQFCGRAVNFHPAILPQYRGPNPRLGMVLDGKAAICGGVTLHLLAPEIDRGAVLGVRSVPYDSEKGFVDWDVRQASAAADLVKTELQAYLNGALVPRPQSIGDGNYRRVLPDEVTLSDKHTAKHAEWMCQQLGVTGWIRFKPTGVCPEASLSVGRFVRRLGPRTFADYQINRFALEFDVADARVRVGRPWFWTRFLNLIRYISAISRTFRLSLPPA
jgi:methionyl-tRNA formyltransferase